MVNRALDHGRGEWTAEGLWREANVGNIQTFIVLRENKVIGFAMTGISKYEKLRTLSVYVLGGEDADLWLKEMDQEFERFAKHNYLNGIEAYGRKGWPRKLKDMGYKQFYTHVYREI